MVNKKILVIGAGAIGGFIGGSLLAIDQEVTYLCRPATARALRNQGLRLELASRELRVAPGVVETASAAFAAGPFDLIVVAVKRYQTRAALDGFSGLHSDPPPILCLQNGIGAEDELQALLGPIQVIPGTVTTAVSRLTLSSVRVDRFRGMGMAGDSAGVEDWLKLLNRAGLNAVHYSEAESMKWSKLVTNLIANPTSAILDMPPSEIFRHRGLFQIEMAMLREALAVMRVLGVGVVDLPGTPVRLLALASRFLPLPVAQPLLSRALGRGRGAKMPSFHGDLERGAERSELDFLHGAVVREGGRLGVAVPVNTMLVRVLGGMLSGRIAREEFRGRPDRLLAEMMRSPEVH